MPFSIAKIIISALAVKPDLTQGVIHMSDTNTVQLSNYETLVKSLGDMAGVNAEKVIRRCTSDATTRAPAWVSAAVSEVYGIKKADVKSSLEGKGKGNGKIQISGRVVESVALIYKGRVLTPTRFKMKPGARKLKAYRVNQEVYKGKRKNLPDGVFLAPSGGAGSKQIPFQREGKERYPIVSIKTVSVPQMIVNEQVAEKIQHNIDEGLSKRLENHVKQMIAKTAQESG